MEEGWERLPEWFDSHTSEGTKRSVVLVKDRDAMRSDYLPWKRGGCEVLVEGGCLLILTTAAKFLKCISVQ